MRRNKRKEIKEKIDKNLCSKQKISIEILGFYLTFIKKCDKTLLEQKKSSTIGTC